MQEAVKDVGLWRRVINGYPYKTIQELGVASREEAFAATKHAIYCYLYGNNPDSYEGIGEAGQRTINAMKNIINNANNSSETKVSSTIEINPVSVSWEQEQKDREYVSKEFQVKANASIKGYKITLIMDNKPNFQGIKVTNMQNQEKQDFAPGEHFKVMVPIKNMNQVGNFSMKVEGEVKTKPVLYGVAPNSSVQDYALATAMYEDGTGSRNEEFPENETKVIIIKEDEDTKERLQGVEFELLNENREVVYSNLITDAEGKIEIKHLIPGKYYLRETKAKDGYEKYDDYIDFSVSLHEQYTVNLKNKEGEKPKIEIEKTQKGKAVSSSSIRKLPVTGM